MEDFRVGSSAQLDAYRTGEHDEQKRRKRQHQDEAPPAAEGEADEYVSSAPVEDGSVNSGDFYSPSQEPDQSE